MNMARPKPIHVTPDSKGGWRAEREGSNRAIATGDNKEPVVDRARGVARNEKGSVVIHGRNGRIQEERTYGPDPYPPKG